MFAKEQNPSRIWQFYDWSPTVTRFASLVHDFGKGKTFDQVQLRLRVKKILKKINSQDKKRLKPKADQEIILEGADSCDITEEKSVAPRRKSSDQGLEILEEVEPEMETESVKSVHQSDAKSEAIDVAELDEDPMVGMISDFVSHRLQNMAELMKGDLFEIRELENEFDWEIDQSILQSKVTDNNWTINSRITHGDDCMDELICDTINSMIESKYLNYD